MDEQRAEDQGAGDEIPLDFEAWAELSARMLGRTLDEQLDTLEELDVRSADWTRSDQHYASALVADLAEGRMERAERYAGKCVAELERRKRAPQQPEPEAAEPPVEPRAVAAADLGAASPPPDLATFQVVAQLPGPGAGPLPPVASAPEGVTGTVAGFVLPAALREAQGWLPFVPAQNVAPAPQPPSAAGTVPLPSAAGSGTLPLGADPMADARATLPFTTTAPGDAVRFPRLPLETYAWLCAELAVAPERTAETLAKYKVEDEAVRRALDEDWGLRAAQYPDTRAELERLVSVYKASLRRKPR
jgi:hypothetical protein